MVVELVLHKSCMRYVSDGFAIAKHRYGHILPFVPIIRQLSKNMRLRRDKNGLGGVKDGVEVKSGCGYVAALRQNRNPWYN